MRIMRRKGSIVFCLIAIFLVTGCATTKKITEDIMGEGKVLKKKIALLPTLNKTGYGGKEFKDLARAFLKVSLKYYCDDQVITDSGKARGLLEQISRLPSGKLDNLALVKAGRALGLNAVLEESLAGIECVTEERGIVGFGETCWLVKLSIHVSAFDVETGALLFYKVVQDEVQVSEHEWQNMRARKGYNKKVAEQLLTKTTPVISRRICELLGDKPWKGYITSVSGDTYTLTAGKDVGLVKGDVLEVFEAGKPIKGQGGQFFLVSGPKIGELKVTKVYSNRADAVSVNGKGLEKSSHVKLKLKQ